MDESKTAGTGALGSLAAADASPEKRDAAHRDFFDDLYRISSLPFLSESRTRAEVMAYLALASPGPNAPILDLGCGWGRHLPGLEAAGLKVTGVERSASYCRTAQEAGHHVVQADVRELPFDDEHFASVAVFYSSIFFFDDAQNLQALKEAARVLEPGGEVVIQDINPIHLDRQGDTLELHPLPDGGSVLEETRYDRRSGRQLGFRRLNLPDGTTLEGSYSIRHYAPGELDVLARRAGLVLEKTLGGLELGPWTRKSRELIAVLRKRR